MPLPGGGYVPLEQVIAGSLEQMFPSNTHWECYFFRLTRGAKMTLGIVFRWKMSLSIWRRAA